MTETAPHYFRVFPGRPLPNINMLAPFKAVVVIDSDFTSEWKSEVCDWLVESGCRYAMTWGSDCEEWHDSVDQADSRVRDFQDNDSRFVMTTWRDNETLEDVFWFSQFCADRSYDDVELSNAVIVHIGSADRNAEFLSLFEQSRTLAERESD